MNENSLLFETSKRELEDEESPMKDVALVGSDGGRVMAAKTILAMHSPFFRRMFFGNFKEADKSCDSVTLDYTSEILRWVVTFCYTGKWPSETFLNEGKNTLLLGARSDNEANARLLVRLREASNYLELTRLHKEISSFLKSRPINFYCFKINLVVMDELRSLGETDGDLWSKCVKDKAELYFTFQLYSRFFQDFRVYGNADGYEWSAFLEMDVLNLAVHFSNGIKCFAHESAASSIDSTKDNLKTLQSQEVVDKELWSNTFDKARENVEAVLPLISTVDFSVNHGSRRLDCLKELIEKGWGSGYVYPPVHNVVWVRLIKKFFDPLSKDEEEIIYKKRFTLLRHVPDPIFKAIKPCSIFTREELDYALMARQHVSDDEEEEELEGGPESDLSADY